MLAIANQYQRCECHECTQARWKMSNTNAQQCPITAGYEFPSQLPNGGQSQLPKEQLSIRESIYKQLSNS